MPAVASPSSSSTSSSVGRTHKTLTPQRKHRKMLKDGTSEVWPESVEEIFVEGLREYWQSPWATFSRGRSRWRNQFLVDYLRKRGIERSKKQVASHIQVLRNMWKGEPEYSLVAGGDELFTGVNVPTSISSSDVNLELQLSAVNVKEECSGQTPLLFPSSPSSSGSDIAYDSPAGSDLYSAALASHTCGDFVDNSANVVSVPVDTSFAINQRTEFKHERVDIPVSGLIQSYSDFGVAQWGTHGTAQPLSTTSFTSSPSSEILAAPSHKLLPPTDAEPLLARVVHTGVPTLRTPGSDAGQLICNRVTGLYIWTQSMGRFAVPVDDRSSSLPDAPLNSFAVYVRLRVHLPILRGGLCDAPWSEGFQGVVQLNSQWMSGHCTTEVYGAAVSTQETSSLRPYQSIDSSFMLPDSWLTRSQWLDAGRQTCVNQQVIVDGMPLAVIKYEFEGVYDSDKPSATVLEVRRLPTSAKLSCQPRYAPPQYLPGNSPSTTTSYSSPLRPSPNDVLCQGSYPAFATRQRSATVSSTMSAGSQRF